MKSFVLFLISILLALPLIANENSGDINKLGDVLVISSYNPGTYRIDSFMDDFENELIKLGYDYTLVLENLQCDYLRNTDQWVINIERIFDVYANNKRLKGIVLLGQEAWASYYAASNKLKTIPTLVCYAGLYGFDIREYVSGMSFPKSIDFVKELSKDKSLILGGKLFKYDVETNINLTKKFSPGMEGAILITDNTYGGLALKSYYKYYIESNNIKDFSDVYMDMRLLSNENILKMLFVLKNRKYAFHIGTWRVNKDGSYYTKTTLDDLLVDTDSMLKFTLLGNSIDGIALAGEFPDFDYKPKDLAKQLVAYYNGEKNHLHFDILANNTTVNMDNFSELKLDERLLTKDMLLKSSVEKVLDRYVKMKPIVIGVVIALVLALIVSVYLIKREIKIKKKLLDANNELIIAKNKAEESEALKSQFLANINHEVRTPLNSIVGFLYLIMDGSIAKEEQKVYYDLISDNTNKLIKIISDILDLSTLQTSELKLKYTEFDICSLCRDVFNEMYLENKKIDVRKILKVPDSPCVVKSDQNRLRQIINNFLSNADNFTRSGFIELSLEVDTTCNLLKIIVTDTGIGISKANREKVFESYEKLDPFSPGVGIGLTISKYLAVHLGGDIYIDDDYAKGTKMILELKDVQV